MKTQNIGLVNIGDMQQLAKKKPITQQSFGNFLNDAINKVNDAQIESNKATEELVKGNVDNLHQVMISAEKANITLQTAVEVRNKVIEAYQEVMRMQV